MKVLENTHVEMVILGNNPIVFNTENVLWYKDTLFKNNNFKGKRVSLRSIFVQLIIQGNIF